MRGSIGKGGIGSNTKIKYFCFEYRLYTYVMEENKKNDAKSTIRRALEAILIT